jgi:hypothetical protein
VGQEGSGLHLPAGRQCCCPAHTRTAHPTGMTSCHSLLGAACGYCQKRTPWPPSIQPWQPHSHPALSVLTLGRTHWEEQGSRRGSCRCRCCPSPPAASCRALSPVQPHSPCAAGTLTGVWLGRNCPRSSAPPLPLRATTPACQQTSRCPWGADAGHGGGCAQLARAVPFTDQPPLPGQASSWVGARSCPLAKPTTPLT